MASFNEKLRGFHDNKDRSKAFSKIIENPLGMKTVFLSDISLHQLN